MIMLFIAGNCYGKNNFKISNKPDVDIKMTWAVPVLQSMKNRGPSFSNIVKLDFNSLYGDIGYNLNTDFSDTVLNFFVKPVSTKYFELDIGAGYHLYDYFSTFLEHDFIFRNNLSFVYKDIIRLRVNLGLFYKLTAFKNINIPEPVNYFTGILGIDFFWKINRLLRFSLGVNFVDYFDYSLMGTPYINLGLNCQLKEKLAVGMECKVKMIDNLAVTANISEMLLNLYFKVSL